MTIEAWLEKNTGNEVYNPGLTRVNKLIETLELKPKSTIITVAGTNGKGSVSRLLAQTLSEKYSVSTFTSPHLFSINERLSQNGVNITSSQFQRMLIEIKEIAVQSNIRLTYYEILFICFLYWNKENWPDFLILEVGLGGRLDATNAVDANIAIITSIARDHEDILGDTYALILREKLGILKKNSRLITGFSLKYLNAKTKNFCENAGNVHYQVKYRENFSELNKSLVRKALELLKLNLPVLDLPLIKMIRNEKEVICFGSHNPDAVRKLVHFLKQEHYNKSVVYDLLVLSFSKRKMKDLCTMMTMFSQLKELVVKDIILIRSEHPKALSKEELSELVTKHKNGIEFVTNINSINKKTKNCKTIICSGSNYFFRDFINIV